MSSKVRRSQRGMQLSSAPFSPFDDTDSCGRRSHTRSISVQFRRGHAVVGPPASGGGFLPPAMPGHTHRIGLDYDADRARELLATAGYEDGRGLPEIVLATAFARLGANVAEQWRETLGARHTNGHARPTGERPPPDQPAGELLVRRVGAPTSRTRLVFFSAALTSSTGATAIHYRNPELARSCSASAERSRDRDERLRRFQQLDRAWPTEHVALVPLCYSGIRHRSAALGTEFWVEHRSCLVTWRTSRAAADSALGPMRSPTSAVARAEPDEDRPADVRAARARSRGGRAGGPRLSRRSTPTSRR